jgi:hypothetical protein
MIPAAHSQRGGVAMLNLFPLPAPQGLALDTTGARRFNYRALLTQSKPLDDKVLRVDYHPTTKLTTYARLLQDYQAVDGYAGTVGPAGGNWGQFPHSYHVQAVGAIGTAVYAFSPTLINEVSYGVNRGKQGVNPLDNPTSTATGGTKTYEDNLLPLKDGTGKPISLPRIFPSSNVLGLLPQVRFDLPSGFSAQSAGQGITGAPVFGHDPRWPFTGTDMLQTVTDTVTWVKGAHTVKGGVYIERMARNVSVYSVFNTGRNVLLRFRPRQCARLRLRLFECAAGQHLRLWRRQQEASKPCSLHAARMVHPGHLESWPAVHLGSGSAIPSRRRPVL